MITNFGFHSAQGSCLFPRTLHSAHCCVSSVCVCVLSCLSSICILLFVSSTVSLLFQVGDVMLGRLVDQSLPHPLPDCSEPVRASYVANIRRQFAGQPATHVWGNTLPVLRESDLFLANLETSVTGRSKDRITLAYLYCA